MTSNQNITDQEIIESLATEEEWKPVFRYGSDYEISSKGRIRSYKRTGRTDNKPRILKRNLRGEGYWYIQLRRKGKTFTHKVARLVAEAFCVNPFDLPIVNHIDGIKTNDKATNLEWCDQSYNLKHAYRTGLKVPVRGEQSVHAKLTNETVLWLREWIRDGHGIRETARKFGVSHTTVRKILSGSKWKHVA